MDARLLPFEKSYFINITAREIIEKRFINSTDINKTDRIAKLELREVSGNFYFGQSYEAFLYNRDSYFSNGGKINGFETGISIGINKNSYEYVLRTNYRKANASPNTKSEIYNLILESNFRSKKRGKLSSSLELYSQKINGDAGTLSYKLIDNKMGTKGAIWKLAANYSIAKLYRLKLTMTGKHSDERKPVVVFRGEFVAKF